MLEIRKLNNDELMRQIRLNKVRNSIPYNCSILDREMKRKLNDTHIIVRKILKKYFEYEAEERVNWWIKFCYYMNWIDYLDYNNILINERKRLIESSNFEYYYDVLFKILL